MRWLPLIALVLLVGIAAGAPYGLGSLAESEFRSAVAELDDPQRDWRITNLDYERGYLTALARYELRWDSSDGSEWVLPLETHFNHGVTDIQTQTRLADQALDPLRSLMPEGQRPQLQVEVGVGGSADIRLSVPELRWEPDTDVRWLAGSRGQVSPIELTGAWSWGGEHRLSTEWPGLTMDLGDARIEVGKLSLNHRLSPLEGHLWQGESRLKVDQLSLDPVLDDPIVADNVQLRFQAGTSDGWLDAGLEGVIGELRNAGRSFGHQALVLKARELHTTTLDAVVDSAMALNEAQARHDGGSMEAPMAEYERLSDNLQALSARGGRLSLEELLLTLPDGTVEGEGFIEYPRLAESEWEEPVSLLRHARAEGVFNVDRGMVWALPRVARRVLERLEREKVVTPREGRYHLDLRLESMELRVNDDRFEVPPLL
ncbi:DUF945 family protein [Halomonadaceae bacterium KBTZ08]